MISGQKRLPKTEDFYSMEFVSTPDYCPKKNLLVYVLSQGDETDYRQRIILKDLSTGKETRVSVGGNVEVDPRISGDGRKIIFSSNATGKPQIWLFNLDSGEKERLTSLPFGASEPVWSPKGDKVAFLAPTPTNMERRKMQLLQGNGNKGKDKKENIQPVVVEDYGYKSDKNKGFTEAIPPSHIWVVEIKDKKTLCITDGNREHVMPVWAPQGETILFASNRERKPQEYIGMDLYTVPSSGGEIKRLTEDIYIAHYPKKIVPRYTPDGKNIVFGAIEPEKEGLPPCYLYRIPAGGGKPVRVFDVNAPCDGATRFLYNATRYGRTYETMQISEDSQYAYFISGWQGKGNIFRVNLEGDPKVEEVTKGKENYTSLAPFNEGKTVVVKCDALNFEDIYFLDIETRNKERLTYHNQWLKEVTISNMEELWVDTLDRNTRVQGWVIRPQGVKKGEKYPAVLYIHGGPTPFYGYALTYEFQCLAAAGIGVIMVNPRGSTGYGKEHARLTHAFDGTAYYDLLQYVEEAARNVDWIDGERLGVCGGSYGGYMTNWIIGHSKRFKAAATHRSPVNTLINYASSDMGANGSSKKFASYEEFMLKKLEESPVTYSDRMDVPLLILHGMQDMRCPVEGAHQLFTAVKDQHPNLPVRMVLFPNSNHELTLSGPMYLRQIHYNENINWFKKFL